MKTEKVTGREIEMTAEELYLADISLSKIMQKEFDEKSAYRLGKLKGNLIFLVEQVNKDRLPIFERYGKKDEKGNITIPQPGDAPVRKEGEAEDMFSQRLVEYNAIVELNEDFQKEIYELFQKKFTINVPPISLSKDFTITPADRMALAWLLGDEEAGLATETRREAYKKIG